MSKIFWDTNLFIYLFEDYDSLSQRAAEIRQQMNIRGDILYTSTLTLGEVLVKPIEARDEVLRHKYEAALIKTANLIPFNREAALIYAEVRRDRSLRAPDAIQLACAALEHVDLFFTNDDRLSRKSVPGIQFIQPISKAFL